MSTPTLLEYLIAIFVSLVRPLDGRVEVEHFGAQPSIERYYSLIKLVDTLVDISFYEG